MYQPKPAETSIQNYASIPINEGLLSKLNPTSFRGKALGAFTAASLLAGCGTAMDIRGHDTATNERYMSRIGQAPLELTAGRAVYNLIRPVNAVIDSKIFDLYTDFKHAVNKVLCDDKALLAAGEKTLPKDTAEKLYQEGCVNYSEIEVGKTLGNLTNIQKGDLSEAVKNVLKTNITTVQLASNSELVALSATYTIDTVKIEEVLHPVAREAGTLVLDAAFWYGVARAVSAATASSSEPAATTQTGGGCFTADTKVQMADGSNKEISKLRIGDGVECFDFKKNKKVKNKVTALFTFDKKSFLHLNNLKVTEKHPFAVGKDSWKEAGKLKVGDQVLGDNKITIKNIKRVNKPVSVFNITVNGTHNYYVSDRKDSFLVHNKGGFGGCFIKESKVTMADRSTKNIEKIKIGDKVLGFNSKTKKWGQHTVTEEQIVKNKKGYFIVNKKLKVSPLHKIYVNGKRKTAPEIKLNDTILNGHKKTKVTSIQFFDKKADRYNIVLGRDKNVLFMVDDILIYNGW